MPRPTGKPRPPVTTNLCRGRCSHCARRRVSEANRAAGPALRPEIVPGTPRWRKASREGHGPPLQTFRNDPPNRTAAATRAIVGRDALIPPHPRGGANARGRDKSRPYDQRKARTQPGNGNLVMPQTPVGDDARIVPRTLRRRKAPGGDKSLPYKPSEMPRQTGTGVTTQASVGRMPSSRRTPRRRKRPRADMESAPTVNGRVHDHRETATLSHRKPM